MPTAAARPTSTRRSAGIAAADKRAVVAEAEARRLFENQLVHVSVKLPKTSTETAEIEFEMPIQDLFANVLASWDVLAEALAATNGATDAEAKPLNPTPRLRRAIASAGKVNRGRFADPNEMFDPSSKQREARTGKAKPASQKRAPLPRRSDFTPEFVKA